jgi:hypothetical protein
MKLRRLPLFALVAVAGSAVAGAGETDRCAKVPDHLRLLESPKSVAQVEAESLAEIAKDPDRIPQVPFGFASRQWLEFKAQVRDGDTLVKYHGGGPGGYLLVRNGCFVNAFNTTVVG